MMSGISGSKTIGIEVKITDRCNQHCFHCVNMDGGYRGRDIDPEQLILRLRQWHASPDFSRRTIKEIRMTGGEPLLNIHGLLKILAYCKEMGIQSGINTNGSLLTRSKAKLLKDAGMKVVKISLDTLDKGLAEKIRGSSAALENTLRGIQIAVQTGFDVVIRHTASRLNIDQHIPCYEYAREAGASKFQLKTLIEAGRCKDNSHMLTFRELMDIIYRLSTVFHGGAPVPEILCMPPENLFGLPAKACGSINKIYVSTRGQVFVCNFVTSAPIGSLESETLEDILSRRLLRTPIRVFNGHRVLENCPHYNRYREQIYSLNQRTSYSDYRQ